MGETGKRDQGRGMDEVEQLMLNAQLRDELEPINKK